MSNRGERLTFLNRELPPGCWLHVMTIPPGGSRICRKDEWKDALVVVEVGAVELECIGGARRKFVAGDVLCQFGLSVRALHNRDSEPAVVVAVSRSPQSAYPG